MAICGSLLSLLFFLESIGVFLSSILISLFLKYKNFQQQILISVKVGEELALLEHLPSPTQPQMLFSQYLSSYMKF